MLKGNDDRITKQALQWRVAR